MSPVIVPWSCGVVPGALKLLFLAAVTFLPWPNTIHGLTLVEGQSSTSQLFTGASSNLLLISPTTRTFSVIQLASSLGSSALHCALVGGHGR